MRDEDQPPPGAVPLSEALNPQLLDALRQAEERLAAAQAAVPPQPSWFERGWGGRFDEALEAWKHSPAVRAGAATQDEVNRARRAAADDLRVRLVSGEWSAWGREDNPLGRWRTIPPDAWTALAEVNLEKGIVCGPKLAATRLYGVVVAPAQHQQMVVVQQSSESDAAAAAGGRRRNAQADALRKNRIEVVLATAKTLWPNRGLRPQPTQMANELTRQKKAQGYAPDTLRKILSGRYGPAKRLGISLDW